MSETKEKTEVSKEKKSLKERILDNETIKELNEMKEILKRLVSSNDYQKLISISMKLQKIIDEDDKAINKTGESAFFVDQKQCISSEFCAIQGLDSSMATLINVVNLRSTLEYSILEFMLSEKEKK